MPGVDTGIDLAPGEAATITATGTATCQAGPPDPACDHLSASGSAAITAPSSFMDPGAPAFSLDGEAGSGPLTFTGTGPQARAEQARPTTPATAPRSRKAHSSGSQQAEPGSNRSTLIPYWHNKHPLTCNNGAVDS
jgi:hypothetical protein